MNFEKPRRKLRLAVTFDRTAADESQAITQNLDHAPAGAAKAGIDAENANCAARSWVLHTANRTV